jgi:sulfite reductase (NADPH) hemoprotein beta-component
LLGPAVPYAEVSDVIEDVVSAYVELRDRPNELFVETVKRIGIEPFKERVYGAR